MTDGGDDGTGELDEWIVDEYLSSSGLLTQNDRKYLLGIKSYTGQQERDRRQDIRNRIRTGLLDLELLFRQLDAKDRELIFTKPLPFRPQSLRQQYEAVTPDVEGDARLVEATEYAFAFLYAGLRDLDIDHEWVLERAFAHGEYDLLSSPFGIENVDVTIEYTDAEGIETALDAVVAGDSLTEDEYHALLNLFLSDPDRFVDRLTAAERTPWETKYGDLSRGESLVAIAHITAGSLTASPELYQRLHPSVRTDLGLDSIPTGPFD